MELNKQTSIKDFKSEFSKQNYKEYWKQKGTSAFKVKWYWQYFLYNFLGIEPSKMPDQRDYWTDRGQVYFYEMVNDGYLKHEVFYQDLLVAELKKLQWNSFFEAGCGFGWNVGRVKKEFPNAFVGGTDFSISQLLNAREYLKGLPYELALGDNCDLPLKDNAYDVGFSLGVYMNIHPDKIEKAIQELIRVSAKYIIHIEWDENRTTPEMRKKRAFKSHIISHDYKALYEKHGQKVRALYTHQDFTDQYRKHLEQVRDVSVDRWEGFEGPEKYIMIVIEKQ